MKIHRILKSYLAISASIIFLSVSLFTAGCVKSNDSNSDGAVQKTKNTAVSVKESKNMIITRIYSDKNGISHFENIEIPYIKKGDIGKLSKLEPATGIIFRETTGEYNYDWHTAPARQYVLMLDGKVDVEVGDGETRRFVTGDVLLVEDTTGKGHKSKAVDGKPRKSVFVTLE